MKIKYEGKIYKVLTQTKESYTCILLKKNGEVDKRRNSRTISKSIPNKPVEEIIE